MLRKPLIVLLGLTAPLLLFELLIRLVPGAFPRGLSYVWVKRTLRMEMFVTDPELGYAPAAGYERGFHWGKYRLDIRHAPLPGQSRLGYRADSRGLEGTAAPGIVALGDSFTYGMEVDQDDTWVSRLEGLTGLRAVNLGVGGYGTAQEVLLYRRYGRLFRPKLVVLLLVPNDPAENELFEAWRRQGRGEGEPDLRKFRFCKSVGDTEFACRSAMFFMRLGVLADLLVFRFQILHGPSWADPAAAREGAGSMLRDLAELRTLAAEGGAKLVVMLQESWRQNHPRAYHDLIGGLERLGIPTLALDPAFHGAHSPGKVHVPFDRHWNEAGHAVVAKELARFLEGEGLAGRPSVDRKNNDKIPTSPPMTEHRAGNGRIRGR